MTVLHNSATVVIPGELGSLINSFGCRYDCPMSRGPHNLPNDPWKDLDGLSNLWLRALIKSHGRAIDAMPVINRDAVSASIALTLEDMPEMTTATGAPDLISTCAITMRALANLAGQTGIECRPPAARGKFGFSAV